MAQRTIAEARQLLTDMAPQLNPEMWARLDAEVRTAEQEATGKAHTFVNERFTTARESGNEAVRRLCELRDEAAALVAGARSGRMTAHDVNDRLNELRRDHRHLENEAAGLARSAELIEAVETDPIGWADNLHQRFPAIRPVFTF